MSNLPKITLVVAATHSKKFEADLYSLPVADNEKRVSEVNYIVGSWLGRFHPQEIASKLLGAENSDSASIKLAVPEVLRAIAGIASMPMEKRANSTDAAAVIAYYCAAKAAEAEKSTAMSI